MRRSLFTQNLKWLRKQNRCDTLRSIVSDAKGERIRTWSVCILKFEITHQDPAGGKHFAVLALMLVTGNVLKSVIFCNWRLL